MMVASCGDRLWWFATCFILINLDLGLANQDVNCPALGTPKHGEVVIVDNELPSGTVRSVAVLTCNHGYHIQGLGSRSRYLAEGKWHGIWPSCIQKMECFQQQTDDTDCSGLGGHPAAAAAVEFSCSNGLLIDADVVLTCNPQSTMWSDSLPECTVKDTTCALPPDVMYSSHDVYGSSVDNKERLESGTRVKYYCRNGYEMQSDSMLVCEDGEWTGELPKCVKKNHCSIPNDAKNGNWVILRVNPDYTTYGQGTKVLYECDDGYTMFGQEVNECLESGYWRYDTPQCLMKDSYCPNPDNIEHGEYICKPSHCSMFSEDTEVTYICKEGFRADGHVKVTCLSNGQWSNKAPVCISIHSAKTSVEIDHTGHSTKTNVEIDHTGHSTTTTVVVVTSCSVLGLLLVILLLVLLQRHCLTFHLIHHPCSPPESPSTPSLHMLQPHHDQDRLGLIAYSDSAAVVTLPSYEEATQTDSTPSRQSSGVRRNSRHSVGSSHSRPGEVRQLPHISRSLRTRLENSTTVHECQPYIGVSLSSSSRDGLSVIAMGSIETVNISDGTSTTVTIDTMDSAGSNPSLTLSQRNAPLSLSSDRSIINDDVPLIDEQVEDIAVENDSDKEETGHHSSA